MKKVIIINGMGGSGKDTVCELAAKWHVVRNISSITPIVKIAQYAGWDGEKTPKARRMLSQLKEVFTEYNDLSFRYCVAEYQAFAENKQEEILFVHIREAEEIDRFYKAIPAGQCVTLLVRRPDVMAGGKLGNRSDDDVEQYAYDRTLMNDGSLAQLEEKVRVLIEEILAE